MRNPFFIPLDSNADPDGFGHGDTDGFDMPSDVSLDSVAYPEFTGLGGGVAAYRGNQTEALRDEEYPENVGRNALGVTTTQGVAPVYNPLMPAAGSVDLIAPRDAGGRTGTDTIEASIGPVSGESLQWSGNQTPLNQPNPNYAGVVTGGSDQANLIAAAYWQSQGNAIYSEAAAAASLLGAI